MGNSLHHLYRLFRSFFLLFCSLYIFYAPFLRHLHSISFTVTFSFIFFDVISPSSCHVTPQSCITRPSIYFVPEKGDVREGRGMAGEWNCAFETVTVPSFILDVELNEFVFGMRNERRKEMVKRDEKRTLFSITFDVKRFTRLERDRIFSIFKECISWKNSFLHLLGTKY